MRYLILVILFVFISCGDGDIIIDDGKKDCNEINMRDSDIDDCIKYYQDDCIKSNTCYSPIYKYNIDKCYELEDRFICEGEE